MPLPIIILAILIILGAGVYNIRSLIKKWKADPDRWDSLLVGIVLWTIAMGALTFLLIKNHILA